MNLKFENKTKSTEEQRVQDLTNHLMKHNEEQALKKAMKESKGEAAPAEKEDDERFIVLEHADDENPKTGLPAPASVTIAIPEETVKAVAAMADDQPLWMKVTQFGLSYGEKVVPEIRGRIIQIEPCIIKFEGIGKPPIKKPHVADDKDIPEGFERRCDIKIDIGNEQIIGISLSKTSFRWGLAPYIKYLINQGLKPSDVITVLRTRAVTNQYGQFAVVNFNVANDSSPVDPAPTQVPQQEPRQPSNNPWT